MPHDGRDTFVIIGSLKKIDMERLDEAGGYWDNKPFAWIEVDQSGGEPKPQGQFEQIIESARGMLLTDDFAPVDNLLSPVFKDQAD